MLAAFLKAPQQTAIGAGLKAEEAASVVEIDRTGLIMAAHSFRAKRAARKEGRVVKIFGIKFRLSRRDKRRPHTLGRRACAGERSKMSSKSKRSTERGAGTQSPAGPAGPRDVRK